MVDEEITMKRLKEKDLYPIVERWLSKSHNCFKTAQNIGLKHSRIDVVGIEDVGGRLSGEIEIFSIEVKRGDQPFASSCGQAFGYSIYANRTYLAEYRNEPFTHEEIRIANHIGIGLIQINANKVCRERVSSPYHKTEPGMSIQMLQRIQIGKCQLCGTFFKTGTKENWFANVRSVDGNSYEGALKKAKANEKGIAFWIFEVSERKKKVGLEDKNSDFSRQYRFICPDCVQIFDTLF